MSERQMTVEELTRIIHAYGLRCNIEDRMDQPWQDYLAHIRGTPEQWGALLGQGQAGAQPLPTLSSEAVMDAMHTMRHKDAAAGAQPPAPAGMLMVPVPTDAPLVQESMQTMDLQDTGEWVALPRWAADYLCLCETSRHHAALSVAIRRAYHKAVAAALEGEKGDG